jgi:hypothetical protein
VLFRTSFDPNHPATVRQNALAMLIISLEIFQITCLVHQINQISFSFLKVVNVFLIFKFMILVGGHVLLSSSKH